MITKDIHVLDKGTVELIGYMADDLDVVNAARVSYNKHSASMTDADIGLIWYLMREKHTTPFEQTAFKWRIKAPIIVLREWHRHRIGWSYNEQSGRYTEFEPEFYLPTPSDIRERVGKPGHYAYQPVEPHRAADTRTALTQGYACAWQVYRSQLDSGVAPEVARLCLPGATYTTMIATCNAHSLMHFLKLRLALNAQYEIRVYAQAMYAIFCEVMPETARAFWEYNLKETEVA